MKDFKELIQLIEQSVNRFSKDIPGIQKKLLESILLETKALQLSRGSIKVNAKNIRLLASIKSLSLIHI